MATALAAARTLVLHAIPPPAGGGGSWPAPTPTHTGLGTWVKIDTTGLWAANGGTLSGAQTLMMDGVAASAITWNGGYPGDPTVGSPIVTLAPHRGLHTFALGTYSWTMDVYWRGDYHAPSGPWLRPDAGSISTANAFFLTAHAQNANTPGSGNSWADGPSWQFCDGLNSVYSFTLGPGSSVYFIVCPGDQGFISNAAPTSDTRNEPTLTDNNYAPNGTPTNAVVLPGTPNQIYAGIDPFGNARQDVTFFRQDWNLPSAYTAPAVVRNDTMKATLATLTTTITSGAAVTSIPCTGGTAFQLGHALACKVVLDDGAGHTQTFVSNFGASNLAKGATAIPVVSQNAAQTFNSGTTTVTISWLDYHTSNGQANVWPDGVTINPSTGTTAASALVTNNKAVIAQLSNLIENQGPASFVWVGGVNTGTNGQTQMRWQPVSLGIGMTQLVIDVQNVVFDSQVCTVTEIQQGLFATTNGVPWIVSDPNAAAATQSAKHLNVSTTGTNGVVTYGGSGGTVFTASMVGTVWGFAGTSGLFTVTAFTDSTHITMDRTVPALSGVAMYQLPIAGVGVPPGTPGGAYVRTWRRTGTGGTTENLNWTCTSAGHALAVPGTPTLDATFNIVGGNAGKIFGPTMKCQGAALNTGPDTGGAHALNAATAPPFNITVSNIVGNTAFRSQGGPVCIGSELMWFSTYSAGTLHITSRALFGTTAANHNLGDQVAGLVDSLVLSTGINQGQALPTPCVAQEWAQEIHSQMLGAAGPPLV